MPILHRIDNHTTVGPITMELLAEAGGPPALLAVLEGALGTDAGMDIAWRDSPPVDKPTTEGPYR